MKRTDWKNIESKEARRQGRKFLWQAGARMGSQQGARVREEREAGKGGRGVRRNRAAPRRDIRHY